MAKILSIIFLLLPCLLLNSAEKNQTILVVGGAGFIGSQVNKMLHQAGYDTIILDNLSTGTLQSVFKGHFIQGDLADTAFLNQIFDQYSIDAVLDFAAYIDVNESVKNPSRYYKNNVSNTLNLLEAMVNHSIKIFIFSSTAAIFGTPIEIPIREGHPCNPASPYGQSKLMVEKILKDFEEAYGLKYCCLRYFNAAGGDPDGEIKNFKQKESNLIPIALRAIKNDQSITIFGTDYATQDGTCVRDYIHIYDLGTAHLLAMEKLMSGGNSACYNLGNGKGFTVKEVLLTVQKITGKKLTIINGPSRQGDVSIVIADSQKAKQELGWTPMYSTLELMIEHAWKAMH
jgi:UDP-glucose 4-epimerase